MNFPPSKRPRSSLYDVMRRPAAPAPPPVPVLDPFEEDFTQDDLDEIDIIASQAITTAGEVGPRDFSMATAAARVNGSSSNTGLGSGLGSDRPSETQQTLLKRKLEAVEEEVLLKSGEIRVLRDSLHAAQQENENHRVRQIQVQNQTRLEQSQRERELSRKVQSLESELQFKEAEINELKNRQQRGSPLYRNSPKSLSSPSPSAGFITKESFSAQVKTTPTPLPANRSAASASSANHTPVKTPKGRRQEVTRPDPFLSVRARREHKTTPTGGAAPALLLLQNQSQRISLIHLLNSRNSSLVGGGDDVISGAVSPVQSLALTGLNMMSLSRDQSSCSGAELLLPLLNSHLAPLCSSSVDQLPSCTSAHALPSCTSAHALPSCTSAHAVPSCTSAHALPSCTGAGGKQEEETNPEENVLVALRTLCGLIQHCPQVVDVVLSEQSQTRSSGSKAADSVSQNALLPSVLRLTHSSQSEVTCAAMKTLRGLVMKSEESHRLRCVLSELCSCLSSEVRVKVVTSCVSALTALTDHQELLPLLCSHDPCIFLKLLQFVRSRTDPGSDHRDWIDLDLTTIRFLTRVFTQNSIKLNQTCGCFTELVEVLVLVLHRLWSELRSQAPPTPACEAPPSPSWCAGRGRVLASLRETVLLFHWLRNHSGFTESLRRVLHLYDQVLPTLKETLGNGGYSQDLALEEICRSEPDDDIDMD